MPESPIRDSTQASRLTSSSSRPLCFRDLYYDEQIAREERLATAGSRLKERVAALKEQKMQRRVILDPKLGLQKKKKRGSAPLKTAFVRRNPVVVMKKPVSWAQREYKPTAGVDRAKDKALAVAAAYYASPKFTRAVSARYDEAVTGKTASLPPKKTQSSIANPYILIEDDGEEEPDRSTTGARGVKRTRTLPQVRQDPVAPAPVVAAQVVAPVATSSPVVETCTQPAVVTTSASEAPRPIKLMPGITRRPKVIKPADAAPVAPAEPMPVAPAIDRAASAPGPASLTTVRNRVPSLPALPDLPMLSRPPRPSHPSLFIPRKKLKPF